MSTNAAYVFEISNYRYAQSADFEVVFEDEGGLGLNLSAESADGECACDAAVP